MQVHLPSTLALPGTRKRLTRLRRVLPFAILGAVLVYEFAFEILAGEQIGAGTRFATEMVLFGGVGALVTWLTLAWLAKHMEEETAFVRSATQRERQFAAILQASDDAMYMLDNAGLIQTWNRGAELLFGYSPDEIVGKHFQILLPKALIAAGQVAQLRQELDSQGFVRKQLTHRVAHDGKMLTIEYSETRVRDEQGQVTGSCALLRDVTERERARAQLSELNRGLETQVAARTRELSQANAQLRQRQHELENANAQLQEVDTLKSEFVSLVSHELRAPLANISGSLQLLLDEQGAGALAPPQREMLTLANEQTERLARLVKGILNVAQFQAGQMPMACRAFDLLGMIERMCEQWRACDPEHVWQSPTFSNLPSAWGDTDRVQEVLMNLFDNAFKYSRTGSTIRVEVQVREQHLIVSVGDEGEGIAEDELEKIFDKFHRAERGDARATYGYGLGLYISRKFIEAMNGELWATSRVGEGSTFYFSLPMAA